MTRLEMVYLMNVALHLPTMKDVMTFEQINSKAGDAIESLKVNPWMKSLEDIVTFCEIFDPPTMNCSYETFYHNNIHI